MTKEGVGLVPEMPGVQGISQSTFCLGRRRIIRAVQPALQVACGAGVLLGRHRKAEVPVGTAQGLVRPGEHLGFRREIAVNVPGGGTGTSMLTVAFNNQGGTVEVDSGTLQMPVSHKLAIHVVISLCAWRGFALTSAAALGMNLALILLVGSALFFGVERPFLLLRRRSTPRPMTTSATLGPTNPAVPSFRPGQRATDAK